MEELNKLKEAALFMKGKISFSPQIGIILGSGLSSVVNLEEEVIIPFSTIPNFPTSTVAGHKGEVSVGELFGKGIFVQRGRVHYYEGYSGWEIAFGVRLMGLLGVKKLIVTNAAGAINQSFKVGDFVLIKDHINTIPDNPLRGPNIDIDGPRFPNLNNAYSKRLRELAQSAAKEEGIEIREGIYLATPGPMYETPAEIRAYKLWGADLVGMSTAIEVIAAVHQGIEVLGISCVTNMAAGIAHSKLTHQEVLEVTKRREKDLSRLLRAILQRL
jgi:purine-nucleoside phosphorylase